MLVDTNVLSQVTRPNGDLGVLDWIEANFGSIQVPALVVSELVFGAHAHPDPEQRRRLLAATDALLLRCKSKFVAFDESDALLHGQLSGEAARAGRTLPARDSMIAAMAIIRNLPVATRNVKDFEGLGLTLINPWKP